MLIGGFQKLTLLDYPEKTAAMVFTRGLRFSFLTYVSTLYIL
jgi:hypothetical protein